MTSSRSLWIGALLVVVAAVLTATMLFRRTPIAPSAPRTRAEIARSQRARNGDASMPLVMKIDVEGAEWDAFLLVPESASHRSNSSTSNFTASTTRSTWKRCAG